MENRWQAYVIFILFRDFNEAPIRAYESIIPIIKSNKRHGHIQIKIVLK